MKDYEDDFDQELDQDYDEFEDDDFTSRKGSVYDDDDYEYSDHCENDEDE